MSETKPLDPTWPDAALERQMLRDAEYVELHDGDNAPATDLVAHVKVLLCRVRKLEAAQAERAGAKVRYRVGYAAKRSNTDLVQSALVADTLAELLAQVAAKERLYAEAEGRWVLAWDTVERVEELGTVGEVRNHYAPSDR